MTGDGSGTNSKNTAEDNVLADVGSPCTPASAEASEAFRSLRLLSFEDSIAAKRSFVVILDGASPEMLKHLLLLASAPKEGRVRQIMARATSKHARKPSLLGVFERWAATETDEFALNAIQDALAGTVRRPRGASTAPGEMPDLAFTFRYLSDRLRHKVLNVLPRAGLSVDDLRDEIRRTCDESAAAHILPYLDEFKASLERLERAVDFVEERHHFQMMPVLLPDWIRDFAQKYQREYGSISLEIAFDDAARSYYIQGSHFLLETVFMNLWRNSQQAKDAGRNIRIQGSCRGRRLKLILLDSGPGFNYEDTEWAFHLPYSKQGGKDRGRGLLEVADAMRRLGGNAQLEPVPGHSCRVILTFQTNKI